MEQQIKYIELDNLRLDDLNPRLPSNFQDKSENEIIKWMLEDESIIELMLAIGQHGFFIGEALLVVKDEDNFTVVEGNRRLTSLKLLSDPSLATIRERKVKQVLEETSQRPRSIPCIVFDDKSKITQYLGYRHVTGIKSWSVASKAKYLYSLLDTLDSTGIKNQSRELAKRIGSRSDYVKKLLVGYKVYEAIKDNSFYKVPELNETTFYFNYITASFQYENIREFMGIDEVSSIESLENLSINSTNLKTLIKWFFEKNNQNKSRVLGNNDNLKKLNIVLSKSEITKKFREGLSLEEAYNLVGDSKSVRLLLERSLLLLKEAKDYKYELYDKDDATNDTESLKSIVSLCKDINALIKERQEKIWEL